MKRITGSVLFVLLAFPAWQHVALAQNGAAPTIAFDITKAEIDDVLKNAPPNPPDRQLRVVDVYPLLLKNLPTPVTTPPRRPQEH